MEQLRKDTEAYLRKRQDPNQKSPDGVAEKRSFKFNPADLIEKAKQHLNGLRRKRDDTQKQKEKDFKAQEKLKEQRYHKNREKLQILQKQI